MLIQLMLALYKFRSLLRLTSKALVHFLLYFNDTVHLCSKKRCVIFKQLNTCQNYYLFYDLITTEKTAVQKQSLYSHNMQSETLTDGPECSVWSSISLKGHVTPLLIDLC